MAIIREFTDKEAAVLAQSWLEIFGVDRHGSKTNAYLWHVFSFAHFPALEGDKAHSEYGRQASCEFTVLSNDRNVAYLVDERPADRPFSDFYIFPPNLAWTMAFTHEDGWLGPYFAQHSRYSELNLANIAKVKKMQEKEHAKAKGWL